MSKKHVEPEVIEGKGYDEEDLTMQEAIKLVIHHLEDLYKVVDGKDIEEFDEDLEDELIEFMKEVVDDIESFIEDINSEE